MAWKMQSKQVVGAVGIEITRGKDHVRLNDRSMFTVMATSSAPSDFCDLTGFVERKIQEVTMLFGHTSCPSASNGLISSDAALMAKISAPSISPGDLLAKRRGFGVSNPIGERAGGRMTSCASRARGHARTTSSSNTAMLPEVWYATWTSWP